MVVAPTHAVRVPGVMWTLTRHALSRIGGGLDYGSSATSPSIRAMVASRSNMWSGAVSV